MFDAGILTFLCFFLALKTFPHYVETMQKPIAQVLRLYFCSSCVFALIVCLTDVCGLNQRQNKGKNDHIVLCD